MIKRILKKIKYYYDIRRDPIKTARKMGVKIGENVRLISFPDFGSEPYLISIGNHVTVTSNVSFITHDGATYCFREQERYKEVIRFGRITIHDNCFIGLRSVIMPGVQIGPNSVVGACSLVTKDIPPNEVWGGVPAKRICSLEEYAEKCLRESPPYDVENLKNHEKDELLRIYGDSFADS